MEKEQIEDLKCNRPHVFLLGSGASVAAFPAGDIQEQRLPTMTDFIEVLQLEPLLAEAGINGRGQNFEAVYSDLYDNQPEVASRIQEHVRDYFTRLGLPPEPTLYDSLLVTLRAKDVVATF